MFGAIVAGRPVLTELQTISNTQFAFTIPAEPSFSHIVVFLLPGNTIPDGAAAGVYIQIPPSPTFRFLGAIANTKQSAIFKVNVGSRGNTSETGPSRDDVMVDDATNVPVTESSAGSSLVLGISLEPVQNIESQVASLQSSKSGGASLEMVRAQSPQHHSTSTKILAQRIIGNAFNFLSSFASGGQGSETVPLKAFQDWWSKFEKRVELDPSFLEKSDDNG